MTIPYPDPFLETRFQTIELPVRLTALCAGYDSANWRAEPFADHLFQWLPFAALSQENQLSFGAHNFVEMLKLAAAHIYKTKKTAARGEIGELIFHLACILHFGTVPVLCKLLLKTASNDTVKGFDGVHIMPADGVRRDKAALSSGCKPHPANAPAGSNRSRHGGNEMSEAPG